MPHKILVVDDEPDLETLITQRFRKRIRADLLTFLFAGNGEEALTKLQADNHVDVVLTDINMPVMDGLTLLSRLREAHPLLRSVIVSAYGDMPNIRAASKGLSPRECLTEAHQFLYGERRATSHFVTCFYGILDLATGQLDYSRAGHNPPYLVRGDQVQTLDAASGLPLGMLRRVSYDTATVQLAAGDTLLLFTDGITEAMNPRQEEYGEERLVQLLSTQASSLRVEELVRLVTHEATAFAEGAPASDDMTVLGVRYV